LALLLGALPMAGAPWLHLRVSMYQLPAGEALRFALCPATLAAVWALDRWVGGFQRYTKYVLAAAAAVQAAVICILTAPAGRLLTERISAVQADPGKIAQKLGAGFFLLLALSVWFVVDCGLQLAKPGQKTRGE
jgi:hypothetical protein